MTSHADQPNRLTLSGRSSPSPTPMGEQGWEEQGFLISVARGDDARETTLVLRPEEVLELELDNGVRLLVSAEDAERYLGAAQRGAAGEPGTILVGRALRPRGPHLPMGSSRDGWTAWGIKALRVYHKGPAGMTALLAAGRLQDWLLGERNGLHRMNLEEWKLTPADAVAPSDQHALLFIHGTASSTEGSFRKLWDRDSRKGFAQAYGQRIYGFEHRSLTESPVENALALVRTLPKGTRLHLVTHSRGGLVGELLARANRVDGDPFSETDIQRMMEYAEGRKCEEAYATIAGQLRELNRELKERGIRVEKFLRVACPARGTTLASGRLDRWASVMLNLVSGAVDAASATMPLLTPASRGYALFKSFLLAVVEARKDAGLLPGLEAMMPESPLVHLLNAPDVRLDGTLHVVAGDYQGDGLLSWLGDCLSEAFYGGQTDLVVNTPSMTGGAERTNGLFQLHLQAPGVHHLNYFERKESAEPLIQALIGNASDGFKRLPGPSRVEISRGGRDIKPKPNAPILFILPGIMGSHLRSHGNRIWLDPLDLAGGGMARLRIDAEGVDAQGWLDPCYERLAQHLAASHEVRPFAYDWRRSIQESAAAFGERLDEALADAAARHQPVRILAHSMGGLVARLALHGRWEAFKAHPGSRLVQLGAPNGGSHAIAAVLLGRDDFVHTIERWLDWRHNMKEFLGILRDFPGILELLPWPDRDAAVTDGIDYFDHQTWERWHAQDREANGEDGWQPPAAPALKAALATIHQLQKASLDADRTCYVAGCTPTPRAVLVEGGEVKIDLAPKGDGRVLWATGIPDAIKTWYTDAAHGDLPNHTQAFEGYRELLESGLTQKLARTPPAPRGEIETGPRTRPRKAYTLYPTIEEVMAAAVGGRRRVGPVTAPSHKARIRVVHGSLAGAAEPVLIGAYQHDSLQGSSAFLNRLLDGALSQAKELHRYPERVGDASVFFNPEKGGKPGGAIVVGLGAIGELVPGIVNRALSSGMREFALVREREIRRDGDQAVESKQMAALLVGTGYGGLSVELGVRCMLEALTNVNQELAQIKAKVRIDQLTLFEEAEDRAIRAMQALHRLRGESRFQGVIELDERLRRGTGGYRRGCLDASGDEWYRLHVTESDCAPNNGALRFTLMTGRARNEVNEEPDQRQAVDGLIANATQDAIDQPGLSRALFELMVPNHFKAQVAEICGLVLGVDETAARYPWELMRDSRQLSEPPLVARIGVVRQLASRRGRDRITTAHERRAFIVGDTQSGMMELPGAQREAMAVAQIYRQQGYEVTELIVAEAQQVLINLLDEPYRMVHLAGHGIVSPTEGGHTGMVLGPNIYLTAAQVTKLRQVPEFVFINCCHLGSMAQEAGQHWSKLAANLATEFIEMGCEAVIAAGWAVDDQAATTFASAFYTAMHAGERFGEALRKARLATWQQHPTTNTWGAYQGYGDERYTFPQTDRERIDEADYVHPGQAIADLDLIAARIAGATEAERNDYRKRLESIERRSLPRFDDSAEIRERLGIAWAELQELERAIHHYRATLSQESGQVQLHTFEQLANLEVRQGEKLAKADPKAGLALMERGKARIDLVINIDRTSERLALSASYWKRRMQVAQAQAQPEQAPQGQEVIDQYLESMTEDYWEASEQALRRGGERDYYPLLKALDGAFLLKMRGNDRWFDRWLPELPQLLAEAERNAQRRYDEEHQLFHALGPAHCRLVEALWRCLPRVTAGCLTEDSVREQVARRFVIEVSRLGSLRELDSTANHLEFLRKLLPQNPAKHSKDNKIQLALQRLEDELREKAKK